MKGECFAKFFSAVDKHRNLILSAERHIWANPEIGYKEWKTSAYLEERFEKLGYKLTRAGNIPGFYADLDTGMPGPKILIFGELDSLICKDHPDADPKTGAVHACGHNAQCATLLGVAAALKEDGILEGLCGSVRLCAVPAEEGVDITYRENLRKSGIIQYYSGKVEFLHRGYFDDVDMAIMVHVTNKEKGFTITRGSIGNIKKRIIYKGVAAHAGAHPYDGINALYAANLGLNAINALRETFKEEDRIRVHPIITKGGETANAIPAEVVMECYVRGISSDAIYAVNNKVNRALAGAAVSMGANVRITDRPGSSPLINDMNLMEVAKTVMEEIVGSENIEIFDDFRAGSTDMGDISAVMPAIHPYTAGAAGKPHGNDFYIVDPEEACINPAKMIMGMIYLLLSNNAERAKEILAKKNIRYSSKEEYFKDINRFMQDKDLVTYKGDGSIVIFG
ncbi:MAG TPA: amidohydrolase [Clostridiaceae bacterium]|nr:amidohydrolase [Clostridiaceae bacterium]